MFDTNDVTRLREALPPLDFSTPVRESGLVRKYIEHYGLQFDTVTLPITHSLGYFNSQTFRIACHYFAVPLARQTGTVFILHGYYDHAGLFSHLIRYCLHAGLSVVIFDLPGHGLSSGPSAAINSFDQYSRVLKDLIVLAEKARLHRPWHVIAQSTGAAVVTNYLLDSGSPTESRFEHIIYLAPLLRPTKWERRKLILYLVGWIRHRVDRDFEVHTHDQEFLQFIRNNDPLQSRYLSVDWVRSLLRYTRKFAAAPSRQETLEIIQGTDDHTVDWKFNLAAFVKKFPNTRTYLVKDARHHLANESAHYRARIFAILDDILNRTR